MRSVTIRKLDHAGNQVFAYPGWILQHDAQAIVLRTTWDRDPLDLGFVVLEPGDRWTEYFYADRWYNIFEIRASGGRLKGWYCNVTRPACIIDEEVAAEDLALDLWVTPEGGMQVLDEDEFDLIPLTPGERQAAQQALDELQEMVRQATAPFDGRRSDG